MHPRSAAARRKTSARTDPPTMRRKRVASGVQKAPLVLIVDDSDDTRDLYEEYLAHAGMRVALAVDGDHALWKITLLRPSLVVMDLALPVLDGWEATRRIKSDPKTRHIPVIALTGHVSDENLQRASDAGADVVLTKPCTPEALARVIRQLLER